MAIVNPEAASSAAINFSILPVTRQIGLLVGLAASIAIGISVALWAIEPNYRPLYNNLSGEDATRVLDALQKSGIRHKLDKQKGVVLVAADELYQARLKLASEGLPQGSGFGFEFLKKENGFGTSQFVETARYRHALENELARTISQFNNVKSARVHLAIPKQSVFVRNKRKPTASVFLDIYLGSSLSSSQTASIVNLVASSIPNMNSDDITVVNQNGDLLTEGGGHNSVAMANKLFSYKHQIEENYAKKIQDILTPMLGDNRVKAKVTADVDFTTAEKTRESYEPDQPALRSEQSLVEKRMDSDSIVGGVPGALSNQPPAAGKLAQAGALPAPGQEETNFKDLRKQSVKNYELDKTISHIQKQPGRIQRLTVAVLVDDYVKVDEKTKKVTRTPLTEEQMKKITALVKDAVGYSAVRGDSVNVINSSFAKPEPIEALPPTNFWEQGWFWDVVKQGVGGIFLLLVFFGVLRPILRSLASKPLPQAQIIAQGGQLLPGQAGQPGTPGEPVEEEEEPPLSAQLQTYQDRMQFVKQLAGDDPQRVAQVVKKWVDS